VVFQLGSRIFLAFLLAFCTLFINPAIIILKANSQSESLTLPIIKRDALLNGLQLLTLETPGSGSISLKVRVNSGAMFDLVGKGGLADLTAGMLLRGGGGYASSAIEETVKQFGLRINISVNWDATDIEFSGPADAAEER
jgi:predicted Zn-dependent peptidase